MAFCSWLYYYVLFTFLISFNLLPYYRLCVFFSAVISVAVYHSGCYIEYLLKLHDGARAFPVHAIW